MKKFLAALMVSVLLALGVTAPASATMLARQGGHHAGHMRQNQHMNHNKNHGHQKTQVQVQLYQVGNSGVSGFVHLSQGHNQSGTHIVVNAFGLTPGNQYTSLYYDNHTCELEPYSSEDVIGGIYTANGGGVGATQGNADDPLSEINSVSVRRAGDFSLIACANVHP